MPQRKLTTYQAVISQARAFRALRSFMSQVLSNYDLTTTEWLLIGTVTDAGSAGVRISTLADVLGVEMPVVTNLVQKSVKSGWVESVTDSADRRAKRISISATGAERVCVIEAQLRDATKNWVDGIKKGDMHGYFAVVDALGKKYS